MGCTITAGAYQARPSYAEGVAWGKLCNHGILYFFFVSSFVFLHRIIDNQIYQLR
jgi:hypothetical protein